MDKGGEAYEKRFFTVVKRGQTHFIEEYLRNIDVDTVNEAGDTALIIAAKERNFVVQKLLIENKANVNKTDKDGRSALHIESGYGDTASINLLLANNAKINRKDSNGRTALHYAVRGSHYDAADLLVFCGADGSIPDENNVTAMELCRDFKMREKIKESSKTVQAINLGYIKIERTVLRTGERRFFKRLGCFVTIPEHFSSSDVYTLSRRVRPEFGQSNMDLQSKELRTSDTFEFRVKGGDIVAEVTIDVPLYCQPEAYEEIHMKTNKNPIASDETVQSGVACFPEQEESDICSVKVNLMEIKSLMLVTRPKKERLPLSAKDGGSVTSTIDTFVKFEVDPFSFSRDGFLVHSILPKPSEKETGKFLACSHFHNISYSTEEQPKRQVRMSMPLPSGYSTDKNYKMNVLVREGDIEKHDPEKWTLVNDGLTISKTTVSFNVPHFSEVQAVQTPPTSEVILKKETEKRFQRAKMYQGEAVFLGMPTKLTKKASRVHAECTGNMNYKQRIEALENVGFIDQNPSYTEPFETYSGKIFYLDVTGELEKTDKVEMSIEYHPKRKDYNNRIIDIKPLNTKKVEFSHGQLDIKDEDESFHYTINLHLKHPKASEQRAMKDTKDFLNDDFLEELSEELKSEKLKDLLVALHVDVTQQDYLNALLKWRDLSEERKDNGVSSLVGVLCQQGQNEAAEFIVKELKKWEDKYKHISMPFCTWLADINPENIKKHEEGKPPKPMSDNFLRTVAVLMCEADDRMFETLGLEHKQIEAITVNRLYVEPEQKNYMLLKRFRDLYPQKEVEGFEILHKAFKENKEKFPGMDEKCLDLANEWLSSAETGDRTTQPLSQYLKIARQEGMDREADEIDADIPDKKEKAVPVKTYAAADIREKKETDTVNPENKEIDEDVPENKEIDEDVPEKKEIDEDVPEKKEIDEDVPEKKEIDEVVPENPALPAVDQKITWADEIPEKKETDEVIPEKKETDEVIPDNKETDEVIPEKNETDAHIPEKETNE